jgi:hypothetical protein
MRARRTGQWELQCLIESAPNAGDKVTGKRFRNLFGEVAPNLGKVYFCRLGKAEVERSANSFLPRAMIRLESN